MSSHVPSTAALSLPRPRFTLSTVAGHAVRNLPLPNTPAGGDSGPQPPGISGQARQRHGSEVEGSTQRNLDVGYIGGLHGDGRNNRNGAADGI
jgi:hypothetical protein